MTKAPWSIWTTLAARGSGRPVLASPACSSSASISVRRASTNTVRSARVSACWPGARTWYLASATGFEFGLEARQMLYSAVVRTLEQYDPARVRALIETTRQIARELRPFVGNRLRETPATVQIPADDLLEIAMQRGGIEEPPIVPYEAAAALAMLLLQNHGMLMVHFVGVPPGTADLLIKFVPPETLERFGGAARYARAIDDSLTRLGALLREPASIGGLLLGTNPS